MVRLLPEPWLPLFSCEEVSNVESIKAQIDAKVSSCVESSSDTLHGTIIEK